MSSAKVNTQCHTSDPQFKVLTIKSIYLLWLCFQKSTCTKNFFFNFKVSESRIGHDTDTNYRSLLLRKKKKYKQSHTAIPAKFHTPLLQPKCQNGLAAQHPLQSVLLNVTTIYSPNKLKTVRQKLLFDILTLAKKTCLSIAHKTGLAIDVHSAWSG